MHTICTQYAHNTHTERTHTNTEHNMQHREQNIEDTHREQHRTTQRTDTAQPQQNSAHNYRTYSLDYYFEYAYIKNSNTIELYTISKENI